MNILNKLLATTILAITVLTLSGCGSSAGDGDKSAGSGGGLASKGPFVAGATVTAYVLTNGIRNTATAATTATTTVTTGNLGAFEFANLDSGITELEITGNYLNENDNSTATVGTLTSIININGDFSNNINIFTDLEARRIKALMAANPMDFAVAKSAATAAVANLFNLSADDVNLSALDLTDGTNEDNLILLRASAAVANTPDILANLQTAAADMQSGNLNENTAGAKALEDLNSEYGTLNFDQIAANITGLGTSTAIAATALAALNQAPTLTITTSTRRIDEDSGLIPIDIEFGNDGNPPSTDENDITLLADSNFSVVSTNPELLTITPRRYKGTASAINILRLDIEPGLNQHGSTTIIVTVTDADGAKNSVQFELVITSFYDDVAVASQENTAILSVAEPVGAVVVSASAVQEYFNNSEGFPLTYSIASGNGSGTFAIDSVSGKITIASTLALGAFPLTISATDGTSTATANLRITVLSASEEGRGINPPAIIQAIATGTPNQVTVYWSAVATATGYKLYRTTDNLSGFVSSDPANLSSANPAATSTDFANGVTTTTLDLPNSDTVYFLVTATKDSNESLTSATQAGATAHNFTFATVVGDDTSTVWIDRNLGASQVTTAFNDFKAYGNYYQWGRPADGHQLVVFEDAFNRTPSTATATLASSISPGNANFITNSTAPNDWLTAGVDDNGAIRSAFWSRLDGSAVCPTGFRVPTETELNNERLGWTGGNSYTGALNSNLKLAVSGYRTTDGAIGINLGSQLRLWSVTAGNANSAHTEALHAGLTAAQIIEYGRAFGMPIRCIQDDASFPLITSQPVTPPPVITPPVTNIPVTAITITNTETTLQVGSTLALTATVTPADATDPGITWTITQLNANANINGNILTITGGSEGPETITARSNSDNSVIATKQIIIIPAPVVAVTGIEFTSTVRTVANGGTITLTARVLPVNAANQNIKWRISVADDGEGFLDGELVVASDPDGSVIFEGAGGAIGGLVTVEISAVADPSIKADLIITVN